MHAESTRRPTVGYVVSAWPRLSETFILNEVLAVERSGGSLRIFSIKDSDGEPVHARVAQVRARVTYLSLRRHWKSALQANLRLFFRQPGRYCRALLQALRYRRWGVLQRFFQAGYLAHELSREPVAHLHAHFQFAWPRVSDAGPPVILSVARLVEKKGLSDLIVAAGILRGRGRRFQVEIIGEGPQRQALEAQVMQLGLSDRVKLLGVQTYDMVCLAYQRASIFALPCMVTADGDRDGLPNVLLEDRKSVV